jgi:hypothetical protein
MTSAARFFSPVIYILEEFFINYRDGSHKHLDKLLLLPFILLLFHHLLLSK